MRTGETVAVPGGQPQHLRPRVGRATAGCSYSLGRRRGRRHGADAPRGSGLRERARAAPATRARISPPRSASTPATARVYASLGYGGIVAWDGNTAGPIPSEGRVPRRLAAAPRLARLVNRDATLSLWDPAARGAGRRPLPARVGRLVPGRRERPVVGDGRGRAAGEGDRRWGARGRPVGLAGVGDGRRGRRIRPSGPCRKRSIVAAVLLHALDGGVDGLPDLALVLPAAGRTAGHRPEQRDAVAGPHAVQRAGGHVEHAVPARADARGAGDGGLERVDHHAPPRRSPGRRNRGLPSVP